MITSSCMMHVPDSSKFQSYWFPHCVWVGTCELNRGILSNIKFVIGSILWEPIYLNLHISTIGWSFLRVGGWVGCHWQYLMYGAFPRCWHIHVGRIRKLSRIIYFKYYSKLKKSFLPCIYYRWLSLYDFRFAAQYDTVTSFSTILCECITRRTRQKGNVISLFPRNSSTLGYAW